MQSKNEAKIKFTADAGELTDQIKAANRDMVTLRAELKLNDAEFKNTGDSAEYLKKKHEILSSEIETSRQKQEALNKKLELAKEIFGEDSQEAQDWTNKLIRARTEGEQLKTTLSGCEQEIQAHAEAVRQAEESLDEMAEAAEDAGEKIEEHAGVFGQVFGANLASMGVEKGLEILKTGVDEVTESMMDLSVASAQLAASTGLSEAAAERYRQVMKEIKGENFGEDYRDVAEVMEETIQIMGELDESSMKNVTESAIALRDTFDMDVNESLRAADIMMKTMGVDASKAFDLIAKGAQNGLNRSGELTDNITEYASLWGQAGFSAEEMFGILENGLDAGAQNLDKVNDYVKEFGVSLADGRIESNLDKFSAGTQEVFQSWKDGEASTKDVFYSVINDLSEMTNKQDALTLASETWSSLGEDNALQVLTALDDVNDGYANVKGTMESIKEVKYSDLESALGNLGSAVQEHIITPIAEKALPLITGGINAAAGAIGAVGEKLSQPKSELESFIEEIGTANDEVAKKIESAQATMENAGSEVTELEAYKDALLEINDTEEKSEFQKYQLKRIVGELSGQIPELASAFDEEAGSLNLTNQEITDLIDNQKALTMQQAILDAQSEAYEAQAEAVVNMAKAKSALETATDDLAEAEKKNAESADYLKGGYGDYYAETLRCGEAQKDATKALDEATKQHEEATAEVELTEAALADLKEQYGLVETATEEAADATEDLVDKKGEAAREFDEYGNDITGKSDEEKEAIKKASEEIQQAYSDMRDGIADSIGSSIDLMEGFSGGAEISSQEVIANLDSQITGISNWSANMQRLAGETGHGMTQEFYDYLLQMGPESANLVQTLVDSLDGKTGDFETICSKWGSAMALKNNADVLAANTEEGRRAGKSVAAGLEESQGDIEQAANKVVNGASGSINTEGYEGAGQQGAENIASGFAKNERRINEAVEGTLRRSTNAADQMAEAFESSGGKMGKAIADGMKTAQTGTQNAVRSILVSTNSLKTGFKGLEAASKTSWNGMKNSINSAMNGSKNSVQSTMRSIQSSVSTGSRNALNSASRNFREIGSSASSGMRSAVSAVRNSANQMENIMAGMRLRVPKPSVPPLPHFTLKQRTETVGGKSYTYPSEVSVNWYAKAMRDGIILNAPGIFGFNANTGQYLAGGEAGSETVVGTESLLSMIHREVESAAGNNYPIDYDLLAKRMAREVANLSITLELDGRQYARIARKAVTT